MNIKVCGVTDLKQLQQLDALNIDYAGFIFYKPSPRYVVGKIDAADVADADFDIKKVGVFVNETYDEIMRTVDAYELDIVQLHGDETPALCEKLSEKIELIKAFRINAENEMLIDHMIAEYDEPCDYYLFDTASLSSKDEYGGSGQKFNWHALEKAHIEKPFFLSGGLAPDDATAINAFKHPDFFGVDINSQFETEPGIKNLTSIIKFKSGLKNL